MPIKFKSTIKGERITLKRTKPTQKTAKLMFETIEKNRKHLAPWFPWEKATQTVEDSMTYLVEKEKETLEGKKIEYGLYLKDEYLGNISIFDINKRHQSGEIGYWISKDHTKKGYMTEAIKLLEKEGFEELKLNRLQILCDIDNTASKKTALKCGYKFEGTHRQVKLNLYTNTLKDILVFSKLKSEY